MKKGRLSNGEMDFIKKNVDKMTIRQLAEKMDRDPNSIDLFVKRKLKLNLTEEEAAAFALEKRPYWQELELQFTKGELDLFRYHWTRIISQFRDDVIPTEELQVIDLIKLELLMNRCLKQNKENIEQISAYEALVSAERSRDPDQQNQDEIYNLDRQIASLKASQESLNRDYRELQTKKNSMLKEMKATREQRVKRLEESKQSFTTWIAHLMSNPDIARKYGIEMEKMRLAMTKEKERLGAFHKYEDGMVDQPLLTPDTVRD